MSEYTKWVACWGNATSITDRTECTYAKDITLRYPIRMCFSGDKLRFHFSNLTGTEDVVISKAIVSLYSEDNNTKNVTKVITLNGDGRITLAAGCSDIVSDDINIDVTAGDIAQISMYFADYTQMNAGTLITGPLSKGKYSYGNHIDEEVLPSDFTRNTNWFYFLNTIDINTCADNYALVCYGDSITAQSWPDYLTLRALEEGFKNVSIIRRAVSGTRILREYNCITYAAYGLKGATRFPIELNVAGAKNVIIQHGINDIIHPVGEEVNIFRPWSDLPTVEDLEKGVDELYVNHAKSQGLNVWSGTLLPIYGWRTYEPFREEMRHDFNEWLRTSKIFDGCVDFDIAVRDSKDVRKFAQGFDSGDHLHPSEAAYEAMARCVPKELLS